MYQKAVVIGPARLRVLHLDVPHCILVIVIGVRSYLVIMGVNNRYCWASEVFFES